MKNALNLLLEFSKKSVFYNNSIQRSNGIQGKDEEGLPSKEFDPILFGFVIPLVGK